MTAKVLIVQPSIQHYRVPVFDRLRAVARADYSVEVCGTMSGGEAIGGGRREYFRHYPLRRLRLGVQPLCWWPGIAAKIRSERPDAVISTVYPSNLTSWRLPAACAAVGATPIGWTKVHSPRTRRTSQHLKRLLFRRYRYILAYADSSREELDSLGYPSSSVVVTNNTIDTERIRSFRSQFLREAKQLRVDRGIENKRLLVCISKMERLRRHLDLLDAWPRLRALDPDLHLIMIGSGSLAERLRQRAQSLDPRRIHFIGRVPEGMDYSWIAAADATIQCGAVGLAINQSMALGKPTIIADERGPDTEPLVDRETGFRFEKGNLEDLVRSVAMALSDDPIVHEVCMNAQSLMQSRYSINHMVLKIHQCVLMALSERARGR